jgi:hypothetical protein
MNMIDEMRRRVQSPCRSLGTTPIAESKGEDGGYVEESCFAFRQGKYPFAEAMRRVPVGLRLLLRFQT